MLRKSTDIIIWGTVVGVKARRSLASPGTAAEMTFEGPRAERIEERSKGYASISHSFSEFRVCL
jgi:hypothetical protein